MRASFLAAAAAGLLVAGCSRGYEGGGELRARKKVLEREVEALRMAVGRLEKSEPILPANDLAVAIDEALLQSVIAAQLPFVNKVGRYELTLVEAQLMFRGAPTVRLRGHLKRDGNVDLEAAVNVVGALDQIAVDPARGSLAAKIVVDHIGLEKAAGIESLLSGSTLDELARMIRLQLADQLPAIQIPVKVQQSLELPAVTSGPVSHSPPPIAAAPITSPGPISIGQFRQRKPGASGSSPRSQRGICGEPGCGATSTVSESTSGGNVVELGFAIGLRSLLTDSLGLPFPSPGPRAAPASVADHTPRHC